MKDPYWNEVAPQKLPFTVASEAFLSEYPTFSTNSTSVNEKEQTMIRPNSELVRHYFILDLQILK